MAVPRDPPRRVERISTPVSTRAPMPGGPLRADTQGMTLTEYLINFALIGIVVLQVRGRRLTVRSLVLPLVLTAVAADNFLRTIPTAGNDLVLEVGLALAGAALGVLAAAFTNIGQDGNGIAVARAGVAAATLWVLGVGSRLAFSLYAQHGGAPAIARFSAAHHITTGQAWAAAFVLMALCEVVARTGVIYLKAHRAGAVIPRSVASAGAAA